jgi:hypothetical protein
LEKAGKRQWEKFLHAVGFGAPKVAHDEWNSSSKPPSSVATNRLLARKNHAKAGATSSLQARAKSMLALSLVKMLFASNSDSEADGFAHQLQHRGRAITHPWRIF